MEVGDISVLAFGAKGDGATDDTAAIQAALDAIKTPSLRPSRLIIPAGEYIISSELHIGGQDSWTIDGEGAILNWRGDEVRDVFTPSATATLTNDDAHSPYYDNFTAVLTSSAASLGITAGMKIQFHGTTRWYSISDVNGSSLYLDERYAGTTASGVAFDIGTPNSMLRVRACHFWTIRGLQLWSVPSGPSPRIEHRADAALRLESYNGGGVLDGVGIQGSYALDVQPVSAVSFTFKYKSNQVIATGTHPFAAGDAIRPAVDPTDPGNAYWYFVESVAGTTITLTRAFDSFSRSGVAAERGKYFDLSDASHAYNFEKGVRVAGGANDDHVSYRDCIIQGCRHSNVSIEGTQSVSHKFYGCLFSFGRYGVIASAAFYWYGGATGSHSVSDFRITYGGGTPTVIDGVNSEGSARFLTAIDPLDDVHQTGVYGGGMPILIRAVRMGNMFGIDGVETLDGTGNSGNGFSASGMGWSLPSSSDPTVTITENDCNGVNGTVSYVNVIDWRFLGPVILEGNLFGQGISATYGPRRAKVRVFQYDSEKSNDVIANGNVFLNDAADLGVSPFSTSANLYRASLVGNGAIDPAVSGAGYQVKRSGILSTTSGSTTVTGTGTKFLTEFAPLDRIYLGDLSASAIIASIQSDTSLTTVPGGFPTTSSTQRPVRLPLSPAGIDLQPDQHTQPARVVPYSATPMFDPSVAETHYMGTMSGNITTLAIKSGSPGQRVTLVFEPGSTTRSISGAASNVRLSGGTSTPISLPGSAISTLTLRWVIEASGGVWVEDARALGCV